VKPARVTAILLGSLVAALILASSAQAGSGDGYFYAKHTTRIPDGHGKATLQVHSTLPNDVDPTLDYVSVSLRIGHPQTRDLVVRLKRPNFQYMGSPQSGIPRVITIDDRETHGKNLGRGRCPEDVASVPHRFTTLNDAGGPPLPMMPMATPPLASGSPPYKGAFAPTEPLSGFNGYHAAPSTDPDSPETWTLTVKDRHDGHSGVIRCAILYLHRI
jgi:hypothetical protein